MQYAYTLLDEKTETARSAPAMRRLRSISSSHGRLVLLAVLALALFVWLWPRGPEEKGPFRLANLWDRDLAEQMEAELFAWSKRYHAPFNSSDDHILANQKHIFQVGKALESSSEQISWQQRNSEYSYEFFDDAAMAQKVDSVFPDAPRLRAVFHSLPHIVMKADLFRLIVVYAEGGIYSDLDTTCLKPMRQWAIDRAELEDPSLELVLGVELDVLDWSDDLLKQWRFPGRFGFIQWTLWGQRGAGALRTAIIATARRFIAFASAQGVDPAAIKTAYQVTHDDDISPDELDDLLAQKLAFMHYENMDILRLTGPRMLTEAVVEHLERPEELGLGGFQVTNYTRLQQPVRAGSLLILPVTYWSPGIPHSGSKALDHPQASVQHEFRGSWREGGPTAY